MGSSQINDAGYVLVNSGKEAQTRFAALSTIYDRGTVRHLEGLGVGSGWQCLEIGDGSGTIAEWLAGRVGSTGRVLTTDLDTRFLEPLKGPNLEVCPHNIGTDPLPEATFDLIHTRLELLCGLLRESGLTSVGTSAQSFMWQSGSTGIAMVRANFEQLREAMIEANYITPQQFDEDVARLNNPSFTMPSSTLWSAWGRRS